MTRKVVHWGIVAVMLAVGGSAAWAGPFACQLEGDYRGSVAVEAPTVTPVRQGTFLATFQPPVGCEEGVPGVLHIVATFRIQGGDEPLVFDAIGFYVVDDEGAVQAALGGGVAFDGIVTAYTGCDIGNAVMFQAGPGTESVPADPDLRFAGSMIRHLPAGKCLVE